MAEFGELGVAYSLKAATASSPFTRGLDAVAAAFFEDDRSLHSTRSLHWSMVGTAAVDLMLAVPHASLGFAKPSRGLLALRR